VLSGEVLFDLLNLGREVRPRGAEARHDDRRLAVPVLDLRSALVWSHRLALRSAREITVDESS